MKKYLLIMSCSWLREINPQPFDITRYDNGKYFSTGYHKFGNEIEVVIKYRFTLEVIRRDRAGHPTFYPSVSRGWK